MEDKTVGEYKFGSNKISATREGGFLIKFASGGEWKFDLGEINRLAEILTQIIKLEIKPDEKKPVTFWRRDGSKIISIYIYDDLFTKYIYLKEGGKKQAQFWLSEVDALLENIRILTQDAPYEKLVQLKKVEPEPKKDERILHTEKYPFSNPALAKSPARSTVEVSFEVAKTVTYSGEFELGVSYFVDAKLKASFGITQEEKIARKVTLDMEALPGENRIYYVDWVEILESGTAIFEILSEQKAVPYRRTFSLIARPRVDVAV